MIESTKGTCKWKKKQTNKIIIKQYVDLNGYVRFSDLQNIKK